MLRKIGFTIVALFLLTSTGLGQDNRFEVSLNGAGVLSKESDGNGIRLTPTQGWGVLGTLSTGSRPPSANSAGRTFFGRCRPKNWSLSFSSVRVLWCSIQTTR